MNSDETVVLRTFASEAEATFAAERLESEGVEVLIRKDDCGGAYPALQLSGGVKLMVNSADLERAETILRDMEGEDFSEVEDQIGAMEDSGPLGETSEPENPTGRRWSPLLSLGMFLLGLIAGYYISDLLAHRSSFTGVEKTHVDASGKARVFYHYIDGKLMRVEQDRNGDGRPDVWEKYEAGKLISGKYDNNFDGKPDTWVTYKDEFNYILETDTDFDGKPDCASYFADGVVQKIDWHVRNSTDVDLRAFYDDGVLKLKLVDTDGDGVFDLRIIYDHFERPIAEEKCWIPTHSNSR